MKGTIRKISENGNAHILFEDLDDAVRVSQPNFHRLAVQGKRAAPQLQEVRNSRSASPKTAPTVNSLRSSTKLTTTNSRARKLNAASRPTDLQKMGSASSAIGQIFQEAAKSVTERVTATFAAREARLLEYIESLETQLQTTKDQLTDARAKIDSLTKQLPKSTDKDELFDVSLERVPSTLDSI